MHTQRGVTLIEVCIAVAIMAMAAAVVIPGVNSFSRADLRRAARGLSSVVRQTYDSAALEGKTYRLVLQPSKSDVGIEATEETLSFEGRGGALVAASRAQDALAEGMPDMAAVSGGGSTGAAGDAAGAADGQGDEGQGSGALSALFGINKLGRRDAKAGFTHAGAYTLPGGVEVLGVWTDGMDRASTEGEIYLNFFPGGYTQDALVHLQDRAKRVYTVRVAALTGRAEVLDHYVEAHP